MALKRLATSLLLALLLAVGGASIAKKADRSAPIGIVAKSTKAYDSPSSVTTLKGNVRITQGSLVVTGDVATLYMYENQQIARVVVTGRPAHIQELDEQNRLIQGDAETLDYDNVHQIAVLTRNAIVKIEGQGEVQGDKLTYDVNSTELKAESTADGFVHGVILPKQRAPASEGALHP